MKKQISVTIFFLVVLMPFLAFGQLKKDTKTPAFVDVISKPAETYLLNFTDPSKFQMNHTLSMSFGMAGGAQMLQNSYLNTMLFNLSDNVTLRTDLGIMSTPYHTFGENSSVNDKQFFGRAELQYKLSKNSSLLLRFESLPYGMYNNGLYDRRLYSPLSRPYFGNDLNR